MTADLARCPDFANVADGFGRMGVSWHPLAIIGREGLMRRDTSCTLDPGLTALALRGLSKPSSYPLVERHVWRRRAAGVDAGIVASVKERVRAWTFMVAITLGTRS
jgi:hypothetical protein